MVLWLARDRMRALPTQIKFVSTTCKAVTWQDKLKHICQYFNQKTEVTRNILQDIQKMSFSEYFMLKKR